MEPKPDWQFVLTAVTAVSSAVAALAASWSARATHQTAQEAVGWSRNPVDFLFDLTYEDPFTGQRYTVESGHVSIQHLAPTAEQGGLCETSDSPD